MHGVFVLDKHQEVSPAMLWLDLGLLLDIPCPDVLQQPHFVFKLQQHHPLYALRMEHL